MEHKYLQWLTHETDSIVWHDSAIRSEQLDAFANGCCGMTTNPFLVQSTLYNDPEFWADKVAALPKDLTGDEKYKALIECVTGYYAKECLPIYEQGIPGKGYVCAQTNPNKTGNAEYMKKQMVELAAMAPNICVKLPGTRAGIEAYEEAVALGLNVVGTVSFTVPQVVAMAEAAKRGYEKCRAAGRKPGLTTAVMMVGRLDDYLRDVAQDSYPEVQESDIVQAGIACFKKAYKIFQEKGYETYLMPAGMRGANQVVELAGAKIIYSLAPKILKMIPSDQKQEVRIDVPVAQDVIDRLYQMPEFRKAYDVDGMKPEEFITFGSANRTTDQFINDGWNMLQAYKY